MKIRHLAATTLSILLAACGGGSGSNSNPAAASTTATGTPAAPASSPMTSNAVTSPTVTNTLSQGVGLTWNQGTLDLTANVPGLGAQAVSLPNYFGATPPAVWAGSALFVQAGFTGTYDRATATTLAGTLAYITSSDGKNWQAGASAIPNPLGSGYVMYPQSIASDGKGTLAVYGVVVPSTTLWANGATEPMSSSPVSAFVAYANTSNMSWTVTMLPVNSTVSTADGIAFAYGNWWVKYTPSQTPGAPAAVLESPDLVNWSASTAPDIVFQPAFRQGHAYWTASGGTPSYSDDLKTWTSVRPMSADKTVLYGGSRTLSNGSAMVLASAGEIDAASNQEISSGEIAESADGLHWALGGFGTFTGQQNGFTCASRFIAYGNTVSQGIYLSDDGLNWTQAAVPRLPAANGTTAAYTLGGCQPAAGRAFLFTGNGGVVYSD